MAELTPQVSGLLGAASDQAALSALPIQRPPEAEMKHLAAGAGIALGGRAIGRGTRLLLDVALTHLLSPAMYGAYSIAWTVERVLTMIAPLGVDAGAIRFGSRFWRSDSEALKGVILQSLLFAFLSGSAIGLTFFLGAKWVAAVVFGKPELVPVIRWFSFGYPLVTTLKVAAAATRISQRVKYAIFSEDMSQPAFDLILVLLLSIGGLTLFKAVGAAVLSFGLAMLISLAFLVHLFPKAAAPQVKAKYPGRELYLFSFPAFLMGALTMILLWLDRLIVGHYRSLAEAGIYTAASQLSLAFAIVLSAFTAVFAPMSAELFHRGRIKRLEELFRVSTKWAVYVCVPAFLTICFAPTLIMSVLFGPKYAIGATTLIILGVGQMVNAGTGPVNTVLVMTGNQNRFLAISAVTLVIGLGLAIFLIPTWGMAGAAVGTAVGVSVMFIAAIIMTKVRVGILPYDRRYLKGAFAALPTIGALYLLRMLDIRSGALHLILIFATATAVFGAALYFLGLDPEDQTFLHMVCERFGKANGSPEELSR
jgi:O-antigen/teichoic acid export membrane protein